MTMKEYNASFNLRQLMKFEKHLMRHIDLNEFSITKFITHNIKIIHPVNLSRERSASLSFLLRKQIKN